MHKEVLSPIQTDILPIISLFKDDFGLVGGTAIALHLGHRESIDFDLFTNKNFNNSDIVKILEKQSHINNTIVDKLDELTVIVKKVKLTFLYFPFSLEFKDNFENTINTPDLLTLAAMKAYALGRRPKWKDYVDMFFIFKEYSLKEVSDKAKQIFKDAFNEKLFLEQLCYFKDIDFTESIIYVIDNPPIDETIKKTLTEICLGKDNH